MGKLSTEVSISNESMEFRWRITDRGDMTLGVDVGDAMDMINIDSADELMSKVGVEVISRGLQLTGLDDTNRLMALSLILALLGKEVHVDGGDSD